MDTSSSRVWVLSNKFLPFFFFFLFVFVAAAAAILFSWNKMCHKINANNKVMQAQVYMEVQLLYKGYEIFHNYEKTIHLLVE